MSIDYRLRIPSHEIAASWDAAVAKVNAELAPSLGMHAPNSRLDAGSRTAAAVPVAYHAGIEASWDAVVAKVNRETGAAIVHAGLHAGALGHDGGAQ
jgi:hypothetical protein